MDISSIILTYSPRSLFRNLDLILLRNGDKLLQNCPTDILGVVFMYFHTINVYCGNTSYTHEQCFCFVYQCTSIGQSFS